jgi:hypothetical protein
MLGPSHQEHIDGRGFDHFWTFRDMLAGDLRANRVRPDVGEMIDHATQHYGLDVSDAAEWCERFMDGLSRDLECRAA